MVSQEYCLRWKHHHSNVQSMFAQLLEKERFCDVTLYCSPSFAAQVPSKDTVEPETIKGVSLRAHRVVLASCSELLGSLLGAHEAQGEPVLVIDGAEPEHLKALLDFMYTGEMNVHYSQLTSLIKTAKELRIKGLTDIRCNNKDEPPDCSTGAITTVSKPIKTEKPKPESNRSSRQSPHPADDVAVSEPWTIKKEEDEGRLSINGGPPPLIKLPTKEKSLTPKKESSETDSPSPKRRRVASGEHTDDEISLKPERDWHHGNMDITAERVVGWGGDGAEWPRDGSDEEWADAPTDIGSFLHTRLQVDGDNSHDESSNDSLPLAPLKPPATPHVRIAPAPENTPKIDILAQLNTINTKPLTSGPKSGPTDPRFTDVVKLSDYLLHGRRPQFWEEHYVKRVMEAVRLKELEMKQAAEILGVSYGTLYGRYRDVYGCINRPYRAFRDFWQVKGPSEVLERLQRGEISLDAAAHALGVSVANLAAHVADFGHVEPFDPIPIEVDPSLRPRVQKAPKKNNEQASSRKVTVGSSNDEESIPVSIISSADTPATTSPPATRSTAQKYPSIRVANIESLRSTEAPPTTPSPSPATTSATPTTPTTLTTPTSLMRTRPDLTIVAAKKQDENT